MNKLYKRLLAMFAILVMGLGTLLAQGTKDDYLNAYLTLESMADNDTVLLYIPAELTAEQMSWVAYSTDATNWTTLEVDGTEHRDTLVLDQGEKVYFKGLGKQCDAVIDNYWYHVIIRGKADHMVYGNIMSLLYGDDFASQTAFPEGSSYAFGYLFLGDRHLVSIENLMLPATSLACGCYYGLFCYCSSLSSPTPELPAAEMEEDCYMYMYYDCEALFEAPTLPATTLANYCYYGMFNDCTSLETAPALPATDLAYCCYGNMFKNCTSLTTAPALPATTLAVRCYDNMFYNCTSLTVAPALPATTLEDYCYNFMFASCSSLTGASEMSATTLANYSCFGMYRQCSSLATACDLPATALETACYGVMFADCVSLTEAPTLPATALADSCYFMMFAGCPALTSVPSVLPATTLTTRCYEFMFWGCSSLTEAPELPATVLADYCYRCMFDFCSSLTKAPVLPAPVLTVECYQDMFEGCTELHELVCLATDISATNCTKGWFRDASSSGTFFKAPGMEDWSLNSISGIPTGWTVADYDGVDEQQDQVSVYPNPVIDKLHITGTDIQSVKVFDMQGRMVHSEECDHADQVELVFQGYAKGIYTVSVFSEGKVVNRQVVY